MSGKQQVLVEEADDGGKSSADLKKRISNTEIRMCFDKVVEVSEMVLSETEALQGSVGTMSSSVETMSSSVDKVIRSNSEVKESQDRLAVDLIETKDLLLSLSNSTELLSNRIDELQMTMAMQEAPAPAEEPKVIVEGSTGFREGPAPETAEEEKTENPEDMKEFVTSREMFDKFSKQISRRDGELANKNFLRLMEKMCLFREDFAKLCKDMGRNIETFTAKDVLSSFEAYLVDIENMLIEADVVIGPYGKDGDQIDVAHQRIVGIVTTDDASKNGTVAERLSDGYEYGGRAICKEKVNVYKVAEPAPVKKETGFRLTPSE